MSKLSFSGHDSFQCRNLWLKKGYEFVIYDKDFNADEAVIELGVGKNMVTAIRYWMRSFGLMDDDGGLTKLSSMILDDDGFDPYLEDIGSLWLLHYHLVKEGKASIYNLFFNRFRKQRVEFTKKQFKDYLVNHTEILGESHSPNTIETDVGVFLKSYAPERSKGRKYLEDQYSSLLMDLNLVRVLDAEVTSDKETRETRYAVRNERRDSLPLEVFLFTILDNPKFGKSISLPKLMNDPNSPGVVFALDGDSIVDMIKSIVRERDDLVYKDDAGLRELQILKDIDKFQVIEEYYNDRG
ncbi:DUF4007 family protein [Balneola sp. MJW-20]|uniref:DUF4007 family protein n=1 Tax=Gracilimonas aurantiaca TaxID=3234185 RepID=UPI0034678315